MPFTDLAQETQAQWKALGAKVFGDVRPPGNLPQSVNHPPHYNWHPAGIEAVDVCEVFSYNLGNAIKYLFRSGGPVKKGRLLEDLQKAIWYVEREIQRLGLKEESACSTQQNQHSST